MADGALGGDDLRDGGLLRMVAGLFPHAAFISLGTEWPSTPPSDLDFIIVTVDGGSVTEVEAARTRVLATPHIGVIVVLRQADVITTRQLIRDGAVDVLPAPVSEAALALSLERLLGVGDARPQGKRDNQVVAVIKAGGGVGATALTVQVGALLAGRRAGDVCVADMDLQFGCAGLYLDIHDAVSLTDCMAAGGEIADVPLGASLARHASGLRVLVGPEEVTPLEALSPKQIDALLAGLRRDFSLTLLDMPSVWTAWTNRALQLADRIVVVTALSVPHIHLLRRQLKVIANQGLSDRPLSLILNAVSPERTAALSVRAAEHALGRPFDLCLPEDSAMDMAVNQGVELSSIRRGTKLEKALGQFADLLHTPMRQTAES